MSSENTQLTSPINYAISRMIFSDPQKGSIGDSKPPITFSRINISTRNEDGTIGDLIFPTEKCFSFGVCENTNPETNKINGYVMPICLYSRPPDGPSDNERAWVTTFDAVVEKCKDHLLENRETIEQYELDRNDLKKLNPLYYKREKGKIVEGTGPTLYAKLIISKKQERMVSMFFDFNGENINGMDLIGKYCFVRAAIKIESIFIGNKISLQVKLYECEVKIADQGPRRLLSARPEADTRILTRPAQRTTMTAAVEDDNGSIADEDEQKPPAVEEEKTEQLQPAPPSQRKIKTVTRKVPAAK
jgi:hypothetical protein